MSFRCYWLLTLSPNHQPLSLWMPCTSKCSLSSYDALRKTFSTICRRKSFKTTIANCPMFKSSFTKSSMRHERRKKRKRSSLVQAAQATTPASRSDMFSRRCNSYESCAIIPFWLSIEMLRPIDARWKQRGSTIKNTRRKTPTISRIVLNLSR